MFTLYIEDINGGQTHEHSFGEGELVVGRSREKCDIVLPADNVSRRHARLYTADNRCYIQDMQSANGVFVDGVRIRDVRELETSSRVRIGDYVLYVTGGEGPQSAAPSDYGKFVGGAQASGQTFTIREAVSLVGRGKDTAITVIDPSISRIHSKLTVTQAGDYVLQDLKSSNGTYVNDQRIEQTVLAHGDRVRFGNIEFTFEAPEGSPLRAAQPRTAAPGDVASPAMPIPPSGEWAPPAHGGPDMVPVGEDTFDEAMPGGGGRRWLLIGIVGLLVAAIATTAVIFLTRGPSKEEIAAQKAAEQEAKEKAEEEERKERREQRRLEQIEEELSLAKDLLEKRNWEQAKISLDVVYDLDPANEEVARLRAQIAKEKPNAGFLAAAEKSATAREFGKALATYAKVSDDSVYHADAQAGIARIKGMRATILEEAETAYKDREWETAHLRYTEALAIDPDDPDTEKRLRKVERRLR